MPLNLEDKVPKQEFVTAVSVSRVNNRNTKIIIEILIKCFSVTSEIFVQVLSGLGVINTKPHGESVVSLKQLITLSL